MHYPSITQKAKCRQNAFPRKMTCVWGYRLFMGRQWVVSIDCVLNRRLPGPSQGFG